ncbi:MAG TPA: ATP-binding protein [Planctomycetota bacterium]|jgi:hypothetical protein|nr:ATP-binding protein [Planctomycetota bacterium]
MVEDGNREALVERIERLLRRLGLEPAGFSFLVFTGGLGNEFNRHLRGRHAARPVVLPEGWTNEDDPTPGPPLGLAEFAVAGRVGYLYADFVPEALGPTLLVAAAIPRGPWVEEIRTEFLRARARSFEGSRFAYKNGCWIRFEPEPARWSDLLADPDFLEDFRGNVDHFFGARAFFEKNRLPYRRGFLLCGPPGNGKTLLLRVLAHEYPGVAFAVFGEGQRSPDDDDLDAFFDNCPLDRETPRFVVFEDLDSLFGDQRISLSHFLNRIDGLKPLAGTLLLATTNRPEAVDPALLRRPSRFDRVWRLGDPPYALRRSFLRRLFGEDAPALREAIDAAARDSEGFSFAMAREVFLSAGVLAHAAKASAVRPEHLRLAVDRMREQDAFTRRPAERTPEPVGFRVGLEEEAEAPAGKSPDPVEPT